MIKRWEYDSTWKRIVTRDKDGMQEVVATLTGDPDELRVLGPILAENLNRLQEKNVN